MLGKALLDVDETGFGLASRAEHGLERLGLFVDLERHDFQRTIQRGVLRFEIDLPRRASMGEVVASFSHRGADLVGQRSDLDPDLALAALEAEFLGARFAQRGACFLGAGVDLADRLFDEGNLVAVLRLVDRLIGNRREKPTHAGKVIPSHAS